MFCVFSFFNPVQQSVFFLKNLRPFTINAIIDMVGFKSTFLLFVFYLSHTFFLPLFLLFCLLLSCLVLYSILYSLFMLASFIFLTFAPGINLSYPTLSLPYIRLFHIILHLKCLHFSQVLAQYDLLHQDFCGPFCQEHFIFNFSCILFLSYITYYLYLVFD